MKKWYQVYVEFWDTNIQKWQLSAVSWWQYLLARWWGYCGSASSNPTEYDIRHVLAKNVHWEY